VIALLSVPPTLRYLRWQRAGAVPNQAEIICVRRFLWAEVACSPCCLYLQQRWQEATGKPRFDTRCADSPRSSSVPVAGHCREELRALNASSDPLNAKPIPATRSRRRAPRIGNGAAGRGGDGLSGRTAGAHASACRWTGRDAKQVRRALEDGQARIGDGAAGRVGHGGHAAAPEQSILVQRCV
jgi:hypothetical protein